MPYSNETVRNARAVLASRKADHESKMNQRLQEAYAKVHQIARNMTYVELSNVPTYMDEFVGACFLPHTQDDLFPSVKEKLAE